MVWSSCPWGVAVAGFQGAPLGAHRPPVAGSQGPPQAGGLCGRRQVFSDRRSVEAERRRPTVMEG